MLAAAVVPKFLLALFSLILSTELALSGNLWMQPGYVPLTHSPGQWLGRMILPWIAAAATQAGVTARLTRTAVLDVLGEDYLLTAHAKGLRGRHIFWRHVLRPAIIPVVASVGAGFGALLGSAAIVDGPPSSWSFLSGGAPVACRSLLDGAAPNTLNPHCRVLVVSHNPS